jgi:DNA helicase II / ATP-dependent DNA helicase PcrA
MIDLITFHTCLAQPNARGYDLDDKQKEAVEYNGSPLWLIAGPGSGKSEVLVTRTLKLLCVDAVKPRSILLTTFTEKAARNLEDRLATYLVALQKTDPSLQCVDLADIRIGTLHSLCNDILQEYRYPKYQNVRLLDQIEQDLFVYRYASIAACKDLNFWTKFAHTVSDWRDKSYYPNKWKRAKAAVTLFNHIVEDYVDIPEMLSAGGDWATLARFYEEYAQALQKNYRCDFAHLQACFFEFLISSAGKRFLEGDGQNQPPLLHVLVDEYQDTNPIQERIYLALATQIPHSITVVGDDDQALYRFRGGNVSCMVNFDKACIIKLGGSPKQIQLDKNYRSHPGIVNFFNDYITSFPEMISPGVRAPGKNPVGTASSINGSYPAVSWLTRKKAGELPNAVASLIKDHLIGDGIISDLSQCVLLLRSAKDSPKNAGPYLAAFQQHNISVYNPRSKSFMESQEVQCLLAALVQVIDREHTFFKNYKNPNGEPCSWVQTVQGWFQTLDIVKSNPNYSTNELDNYLKRSNADLPNLCASNQNVFLNLNLLEIIYRILALEPFRTWQQDPIMNLRLSKVSRLFDGYHSFKLDGLRSNSNGTDLDPTFLNRFYTMFVSYLIEAGIDDDEDEEVIAPQGFLPVMTIHQAKGLEFPFVFVAQLGQKGQVGAAQILEQDLAPFRQDIYSRNTRSPELLAVEDDIRLLYVAYSRAKHGLILVGTQDHIKNNVAAPGRKQVEFRRNTLVI